MLLGMGPASDITPHLDFFCSRYDIRQPFSRRMGFWQSDDRQMIGSDHLKEVESGKDIPAFRCRYDDQITGIHTLDYLFGVGLDQKREFFKGSGNYEKRRGSTDDDRPVTSEWNMKITGHLSYISVTSSDWQVGHIGCFPIPVNVAPQSLHLYFLPLPFKGSLRSTSTGPPAEHIIHFWAGEVLCVSVKRGRNNERRKKGDDWSDQLR